MKETPRLSIVIPAFNEASRLPPSLAKIIDFTRKWTDSFEVLVVVEKSADDTLELARRATEGHGSFRVIDNAVHRGKGYAVRSGMLLAQGEYVLYMDADLSVPLSEIFQFMAFLDSHPELDVLIGNRHHADSAIVKRQSLLRQTMGRTFNRIIQGLSSISIRDTQCGFKAFRQGASRAIFERQKMDGFAFDVEVLLLADRLGFRTADLPVTWINSADSKVNIVTDSLKMIRDAIRVRSLVDRTVRAAPLSDATAVR